MVSFSRCANVWYTAFQQGITHHLNPNVLKGNPPSPRFKGIHTPHSHITSALPIPFNCPTRQRPPVPLFYPSVAPTLPISPADWGPLSSPKQPAAVQTDSPSSRCSNRGSLKTVGTAAQQLFAGHPDRAWSQKALDWVLLKHLALSFAALSSAGKVVWTFQLVKSSVRVLVLIKGTV